MYARIDSPWLWREMRDRAGLSLRQVAAAVGHPTSHTLIGRIERGATTTCTVQFANAVLDAINVPHERRQSFYTVVLVRGGRQRFHLVAA